MKKDNILKKILFIFGIALAVFSFGMLIYQIIHISIDNLPKVYGIDNTKIITIYIVIEFATIIFRLILSLYAIYGYKHIDDVINPLFTFTVLYLIFVIIEVTSFFVNGAFSTFYPVSSANVMMDIVVVIFFSVVVFLFKIDDWRMIKEADL